MSTALTRRDAAAAVAVVVIWGLNFIAMKYALHDFTPFQLGAARYASAVLPLIFFIRPPALPVRWVVLYGLFQGLGQFGFLFTALQVGMTAALASVLMQTQVFFTALLGLALLGERMGRPLQLGMALAALGLGCFVASFANSHSAAAGTVAALGFVLNLCAAFMWAASNVVARRAQQANNRYEPLQLLVWSSAIPVLPFLLMSALFDPVPASAAQAWTSGAKWASVAWTSWLGVLFLGWVATILAYGLWTGLLKRHPTNRVAPFSLGVPVVGITSGVFVLGEPVTPWQAVGIALVVAALVCVVLGGSMRQRMPQTS